MYSLLFLVSEIHNVTDRRINGYSETHMHISIQPTYIRLIFWRDIGVDGKLIQLLAIWTLFIQFLFIKNNVSETGFCLRRQVKACYLRR
jgi:hypothetical protein